MRIRGYRAVLWREPGVSQVGTETAHATIVRGLSTAEQHFLDQFPTAMSRGSVYHLARRTQVPVSRARRIVEDLEAHGAVERRPGAEPSTPDEVYWDRLGGDARGRGRVLDSATVALYGSGALPQEIALLLAEAGVGTILSPTAEEDGLEALLAHHAPTVRTRAGLGAHPDLVITVEPHVIDPLRARRLAQEGLAHLPVLVREVSVRVGPVLGEEVCATCLDLWERDADPCWPALATQMRTLAEPEVERLLAHQAAALAARAAIDALMDSASPSPGAGAAAPQDRSGEHLPWGRHSIELSGTDPLGLRRRWPPHPECLCAALP
ncbi:helix-turn-helix domain-containing protein [Actinomyces bowdenii]|uniref:Thiamin biosynthesis protein n=1 Tax=Actinomyces capricornis TaxID=2755559 RepID=A0ABN6K2Z9_9ACTO|nr:MULTISPECIES: helix-turn-helix domain-containing protein [Actinomyces]MCR2051659.1 helix-turn-helix domain-containing protein [Actinomyces bowdenii]BDA63472.1 thiamin biosynthesis protein [Actinomyces capricornis]